MKLFILALLASVFCTAIKAQCDKNLILQASKTEYLDEKDEVKKVMEERTKIEITKTSISISPGDNPIMTGNILSSTCEWKIPFKEGKSQYKTTFDQNGESKSVTVTIEAKDGKVYFLAVLHDSQEKRIRVWADSFMEKQ